MDRERVKSLQVLSNVRKIQSEFLGVIRYEKERDCAKIIKCEKDRVKDKKGVHKVLSNVRKIRG